MQATVDIENGGKLMDNDYGTLNAGRSCRPMTAVDITEEDAEFQESLRLQTASEIIPVGSCWHQLG